jgi:Protein of unknown function (DUF3833)
MKRRFYLMGAGMLFCGVAMGLFLAQGCSSIDPKLYAKETPVLDLREYLNGPLEASGMFQDRKGVVIKRFHVKMVGTWSNNVGRLEEDFVYSDSTTQRRVWTITKLDDHTYTGTADDVIGSAKGEAYGNALNWSYTLALPVDGTIYHVRFDDWMFLMDEKIMLNRAVMSKWGYRLGDVTLSFTKGTTAAR